MGKRAILFLALTITVLLTSSAPAFIEDPKPNIDYIGPVGEHVVLYEYRGRSGWCAMLIGNLHGKTVSIDCESY